MGTAEGLNLSIQLTSEFSLISVGLMSSIEPNSFILNNQDVFSNQGGFLVLGIASLLISNKTMKIKNN